MRRQRRASADGRRPRRQGRPLQRRRRRAPLDRAGRHGCLAAAARADAGRVRAQLEREVHARRMSGREIVRY